MFWSSSYPSFKYKAWHPADTQNREGGGEGEVAKAAPGIHLAPPPEGQQGTPAQYLTLSQELWLQSQLSLQTVKVNRTMGSVNTPKAEVPQRHFTLCKVMNFILGIICPNVHSYHIDPKYKALG